MEEPTIFDKWSTTPEELSAVIEANPSLQGMILGYLAEHKLKQYLGGLGFKPDDHDRTQKGDLVYPYKGRSFLFECKSVQRNSVKIKDGKCYGTVQCDASDCRTITLPNGEVVKTTCLLGGEFDILAVSLYNFHGRWEFAFAKNSDLPKSTSKKYTPEQKQYLLSSSIKLSPELAHPFCQTPFPLMDELIEESSSTCR